MDRNRSFGSELGLWITGYCVPQAKQYLGLSSGNDSIFIQYCGRNLLSGILLGQFFCVKAKVLQSISLKNQKKWVPATVLNRYLDKEMERATKPMMIF